MNWSSNTIYVDVDTGEKLTAEQGKNIGTYIVIKTIKNVKIKHNEGRGHIEYTKQCKRNPQSKLDLDR